MERKILAAVDGSVFSFNALRYLGQLFTDLEGIVVHLLYVVPGPPPAIGAEWVEERDRMLSLPKEVQARYRGARRFMEEAVLQLGRRGIAPSQVECRVQLTRQGVAADIVNEARRGDYDALLLGRRGVGGLEAMISGSVSETAARQCYDLPLWIVDGKVNARRFLLPVDTSFNSLKAADHLGFILQGNPYAEIVLLHLAALMGGDTAPDWEELRELWGEEWCEANLRGPDSVHAAPEQLLIERGVAPERISRGRKEGCLRPHGPILRHSVSAECGTIVLGRRSQSKKRGLFAGVSDKVLDLANEVAVWLVG